MPGDLLRNVAAASIVGCMSMLFVRKGAQKEILRIAVGILIILVVVLPLSGETFSGNLLPGYSRSSTFELRETQEGIYRDALADTTENLIEEYFRRKGMEVDAEARIKQNEVDHLILHPQQAYEWTQEDARAFDSWSGITREKQEWIWN